MEELTVFIMRSCAQVVEPVESHLVESIVARLGGH